jgi:hypothetical protein
MRLHTSHVTAGSLRSSMSSDLPAPPMRHGVLYAARQGSATGAEFAR